MSLRDQTRPDHDEPDVDDLDDLGVLPRTRSTTRWDRLWRPFWVLPVLIVVTATVAGIFLPELDRTLADELPYVFPGGPSGARSMLGTIAGAMISVTGLVFSITMVVIQLASSQFTPRVLGDFLSNRVTQTTLGIFTASFTYSLAVLRSVQGQSGESDAFVPQLSVTVGFVLVLASVGMFLAFIHHTTSSIQVGTIVSQLGRTTVQVAERYYPDPDDPPRTSAPGERWTRPGSEPVATLAARDHGHLVEVHHRSLVTWAAERGAVVEVLLPVGGFAVEGIPALHVSGGPELSEEDAARLRGWVVIEQDRYHQQDPALGIRKLVDIAERALSPGTNDPTTATQVLDELHRVLRALVRRRDLPQVVRQGGQVRLVHRPQEIGDLIDLALEEILHYGEQSLQVPRRVLAAVDDLRTASRPEHRAHLDRWERVARDILDGLTRGTDR